MADHAARNYLTDEQVKLLLKAIHPQRVLSLKNLAYVAGHDIRAELTRIFGFCRWSDRILHEELIREEGVRTNAGKPAWYVVYRTRLRLSVFASDGTFLTSFDGSHVGDSTHPVLGDAHGNALTNSNTYALRRAAINLGDQFGLSLYNKGSVDALVRWTLVGNEPADTDDVVKVEAEEQLEVSPEEVRVVPPRARRQPAAKKETERPGPVTAQDLALDAFKDVKTTEELRGTWKLAGELGHLKTVIWNPAHEDKEMAAREKLMLETYLMRRSDELGMPKSDSSAPADPGTAGGAG